MGCDGCRFLLHRHSVLLEPRKQREKTVPACQLRLTAPWIIHSELLDGIAKLAVIAPAAGSDEVAQIRPSTECVRYHVVRNGFECVHHAVKCSVR